MSATTRGPDDLQTCSLCQRRYNINVYQRHITENQCIKRNQHRLPFQSIKQRTIRIGDRVFSVQQQIKHESFAPTQLTAQRDQQKQLSPAVAIANTNNNYRPSLPRVASINRRQATLAQAKLLLERRTKYQPPWIQKRSNADGKISSIIHQTSSVERASPPRTLFPTDDLPIRPSDRYVRNQLHQPILTQSPKMRASKMSRTSNPNPTVEVDQTFTQEPRKATTWTRPSKPSPVRTTISPIDIPTFAGYAAGPRTDRLPTTVNQNYVDDVFERYSPSPPSTPRAQPSIARPITYQRAKRSDPVQQHGVFFASTTTRGHYPSKAFHLPPLKAPSPRKCQQYFPTANFRPWR